MELHEILRATNQHGQKFVNMWLKDVEILGTETTKSDVLRKEFTIIYRHKDGSVATAVIPNSTSINSGCCFFGDLKHFSMCYAEDKSGVHLKLGGNGHIMWPVWYTNREDFAKWKKFYDEMMMKYS